MQFDQVDQHDHNVGILFDEIDHDDYKTPILFDEITQRYHK